VSDFKKLLELSSFNRALIAVLAHILFVTFFSLFVFLCR